MAQFNIFRVAKLAISTVTNGDFYTHKIITVDVDGMRDEVNFCYTKDGKELITSMNGKRISKEA